MIYIIRHKFTIKQLFAYNILLVEETGIHNFGILMNGIKTKRRGYGYEEKKTKKKKSVI